ncbi:secreted protein [Candidatus Magnetomorum sp. HK-1]|nr:secreted protein [Candidatus Magnetomorum sp. HK-1]
MKTTLKTLGIASIILFANMAFAEILTVDKTGAGDYTTIKAAINSASEWAIINIGPGVYNESLDVKKNVSLIGSGPNFTCINSTFDLADVNLDAININKTLTGTIAGLKIISNGNGIVVNTIESNFTIRNCIIDNCSNGIRLFKVYSNTLYIINNLIINCRLDGIALDSNNSSWKNYATIQGNIIAYNGDRGIYAQYMSITLSHNNVYKNDAGNYSGLSATVSDITQNPKFINEEAGNYTLQSTSPCINTGIIGAGFLDPDGSRNDMGAYAGISARSFWPYPQHGPIVSDFSILPASVPKGGKIHIKAKGQVRNEL